MKTSDHTKRLGCFIFNFVQKSWIQTCDQFCKDVQIVYHGCHQYIAIPSTHVAAITGRVLILPTISFAVDIAKFQFLWHSLNILVTSVTKNTKGMAALYVAADTTRTKCPIAVHILTAPPDIIASALITELIPSRIDILTIMSHDFLQICTVDTVVEQLCWYCGGLWRWFESSWRVSVEKDS